MPGFERNIFDNNDIKQKELDTFMRILLADIVQTNPIPDELKNCVIAFANDSIQLGVGNSINSNEPSSLLINLERAEYDSNSILRRNMLNAQETIHIVYHFHFRTPTSGNDYNRVKLQLEKAMQTVRHSLTNNRLDEPYFKTINNTTYNTWLDRNNQVSSVMDGIMGDFDLTNNMRSSMAILMKIYKTYN